MHWRKGIGIHADAPAGLSSTAHRLTREVEIKSEGNGQSQSQSHGNGDRSGDCGSSSNNSDRRLSNSICTNNSAKAMVIA